MTIRRYLADPRLSGEVNITRIIEGEKTVIRTDETFFHVQGGGQKADLGRLGAAIIIDVKTAEDGQVDHFVTSAEGLASGQKVLFAIDADRRLLNSRLHSAGHLLAGVVEELLPAATAIAGHHWPGECRVDFVVDGAIDLPDYEAQIEAAVTRAIAANLPVEIIGDPLSARECRIGTYQPIACGGTHIQSTNQLGVFKLRSLKLKGGKLRIGYSLDDGAE